MMHLCALITRFTIKYIYVNLGKSALMLSAIAQQARLSLEAIEMDFLRLPKHTHELMKALLLSCRLPTSWMPIPPRQLRCI